MSACADLIRFVDGELEPEPAAAFRHHLSSCDACQSGLVEAMQLSTRLHSLSPAPRPAPQPAPPGPRPSAKPIRRTTPRPTEASFPNRSGCAGVVVWTLSTLLPTTAIALLRMWPWVVRTRCRSQNSTI